MPDSNAAMQVEKYADEKLKEQDSMGGIIECVVTGMMAGVGDPVFEKLDANLAKAIMSIGAVKGFEIGDGFAAADSTGSTNNDSFTIKDGRIVKKTNHSGGVLGGMSDGSDIIIRAAVKPTPSIARTQETVNKSGEDIEISIKGRHDPMIVPRAVVVVEAMTAVTLVDMIFANMTSRIDSRNPLFCSCTNFSSSQTTCSVIASTSSIFLQRYSLSIIFDNAFTSHGLI